MKSGIIKLKTHIVCFGGKTKREASDYMYEIANDLYKSGIKDVKIDGVRLRIDTPKCFIVFFTNCDIERYRLKGRHCTEAFGFNEEIMKHHLRINEPIYQGSIYEYISEIENVKIEHHKY